MSALERAINDLVIANRVLANEGVVDAYGHVSLRHPDDPGKYLLSRSRSPEHVAHEDILEFTLDSRPVGGRKDKVYLERFIHGAIYEANPDVNAVVHSHAAETLAFGISSVPLRPVIHVASACGPHIPVWDIAEKFGDTTLLVETHEQGQDLAKFIGHGRVALMRGHGFAASGRSLGEVLKIAIYLPRNARVLLEAMQLGGDVRYLTEGEMMAREKFGPGGADVARAIEYWARRAGCGDLIKAE